MGSLNERNELKAHADLQRVAEQRAARLIALGADRGVAREIAAIEFGLISGDRIELDDREGRGSGLSLRTAEEPGISFAGFTPSEKTTIPNILTTMPPVHEQRVAGHGKTSHGSPS